MHNKDMNEFRDLAAFTGVHIYLFKILDFQITYPFVMALLLSVIGTALFSDLEF